MKLLSVLLRASWRVVVLSAVAALVSGAGSAALVALANAALARHRETPLAWAWAFAGICAVVLFTRAGSRVWLVRLSQDAVFDLRPKLTRRILGLAGLDAQAREYLARLELSGTVEVTDGAFSTIALSHGQRKRLALLAAYLQDRAIYVFDEWASDQDPLFKAVFYAQLLPELKARGKSVLVISHDDRYWHVADRIVKLESGQVVG